MSAGQELWVKRLKWEGLPGFNKMKWTALYDPSSTGATGAFYKTYRNFAFYWILKAGHMVGCWPPFASASEFPLKPAFALVADPLRPGTDGAGDDEDDHSAGLIHPPAPL